MKYAFLILLLAMQAGCTSKATAPQARLSFGRFVSVMSELGTSQPQQRAAILQKHRTSDAELRQFVTAYASEPYRLSAAFDSVERIMERKRASDP